MNRRKYNFVFLNLRGVTKYMHKLNKLFFFVEIPKVTHYYIYILNYN